MERDVGLGNGCFLGCFRKILLGAKGDGEETQEAGSPVLAGQRRTWQNVFFLISLISEPWARGSDNVVTVEGSENGGGRGGGGYG